MIVAAAASRGEEHVDALGGRADWSARTRARIASLALFFEHASDEWDGVERVFPAHPVLPPGHPTPASNYQPRRGPRPRQPPLRTVNPLRVTAGGLRLTGYCPGQLHAWVRLTTGTWLGFCSFVAHSGNHRATLELWQWLPASAITSRQH